MRAKRWLQEGRFHLSRKKSLCQARLLTNEMVCRGAWGVLRTRQLGITCQGCRRCFSDDGNLGQMTAKVRSDPVIFQEYLSTGVRYRKGFWFCLFCFKFGAVNYRILFSLFIYQYSGKLLQDGSVPGTLPKFKPKWFRWKSHAIHHTFCLPF